MNSRISTVRLRSGETDSSSSSDTRMNFSGAISYPLTASSGGTTCPSAGQTILLRRGDQSLPWSMRKETRPGSTALTILTGMATRLKLTVPLQSACIDCSAISGHLLQARFERLEQLAGPGGLAAPGAQDGDLLAARLPVDQGAQLGLVLVAELPRFEGGGQPADQLGPDRQLLLGQGDFRQVERPDGGHLVDVPQGGEP